MAFWNRKKTRAEKAGEPPKSARPGEDLIKDDLLGADDYRRSKLGYFTGLSVISRVAGNSIRNVSQSVGRVALTFKLLTKTDDVPSLPPIDSAEYDKKRRFDESKALHNRSSSHIVTSVANTRRSAYLYGAIFTAALAYLIFEIPNGLSLSSLLLHLAPLPLSAMLCFKACYYNWMFRTEQLDDIKGFIRSKDWFPG
jgi:hypothetical protein